MGQKTSEEERLKQRILVHHIFVMVLQLLEQNLSLVETSFENSEVWQITDLSLGELITAVLKISELDSWQRFGRKAPTVLHQKTPLKERLKQQNFLKKNSFRSCWITELNDLSHSEEFDDQMSCTSIYKILKHLQSMRYELCFLYPRCKCRLECEPVASKSLKEQPLIMICDPQTSK